LRRAGVFLTKLLYATAHFFVAKTADSLILNSLIEDVPSILTSHHPNLSVDQNAGSDIDADNQIHLLSIDHR
jgi:hypothetical protein